VITFERVRKVYPNGTTAISDLSLTAQTGQLTVFIGPSGCGKTTSLRMVNRLIEPTSGRILLGDQDATTMDKTALRRRIGYVIQHAGLFPHRTIEDNVALTARLRGAARTAARATARELLERVGLDSALFRRYPWQLSGGQQQRVGVARALAADSEFLLMDEPFSAVDPIVRAQLQDEFLRLQREFGKTIIMVTHDIDEALKLGDRIAVFGSGGVIEQFSPPADLLHAPANDYVTSFVGADRGYRALGFRFADEETLVEALAPVVVNADGAHADAASEAGPGPHGGMRPAVDEDGRPRGWIVTTAAGATELRPLGATARVGDSLRLLMNAALSSPASAAIVVDADGVYRGVVRLAAVAAEIAGGAERKAAV
jgi:osmoprotectant transport system ATP-binding protein